MNLPFATEAPLTYETFKVGVTFTFNYSSILQLLHTLPKETKGEAS